MERSPPRVRLPAWFQGYGCQGSLSCCSRPWQVPVFEDEGLGIAAHLAKISPKIASEWSNALVVRGGFTVIKQPGGRCAMNDADSGRCAAQTAGGLGALSTACRNFPRSVVTVGDAVEVAFSAACPTVAAMLFTAKGGFRWADAPEPWPYTARAVAPDPLPWSHGGDMTSEALEALRMQWWARIEVAVGPQIFFNVLEWLRDEPSGAQAHQPTDASVHETLRALGGGTLRTMMDTLAGVPKHGPGYGRSRRALLGALGGPIATAQPTDILDAWVAPLKVWLAMGIQNVGIHDGLPIAAGLRRAATQTHRVIRVAHALRQLPTDVRPGTPDLALRDAFIACSNLRG